MIERNDYIGRAQNLDLYGLTLVGSKAHRVVDNRGKEYIDFFSAASSVSLGYQRKDLLKAYADQCKRISQTCSVYTYVPVIGDYAKRLVKTSKIPHAKVLFGAFGSDSVDAALKCAQVYTKRRKIIAFKKSYHGGTFLSLAANGFDRLKENLHLPDFFEHLEYPDKSRYHVTIKAIERHLKSGEVACVFMETILGDGGVIEPHPDFYKTIVPMLKKYGALLALDEIQTGVGRTGTFWGYEQFGIVPDLFCTAKGLGGGYVPLSACIGRGEVIDSLAHVQNAFTMCAHPPSCAVGLRVIDAIYDEHVLQNVKKIHALMKREFTEQLKDSRLFKEVRGRGLMFGLYFDHVESLGPHIGRICLDHGVYVGYYGNNNNVLRVHPHLNIDEQTARAGVKRVVASVREFEANMKRYIGGKNYRSFFTS